MTVDDRTQSDGQPEALGHEPTGEADTEDGGGRRPGRSPGSEPGSRS